MGDDAQGSNTYLSISRNLSELNNIVGAPVRPGKQRLVCESKYVE
jgi:hypothetical protein